MLSSLHIRPSKAFQVFLHLAHKEILAQGHLSLLRRTAGGGDTVRGRADSSRCQGSLDSCSGIDMDHQQLLWHRACTQLAIQEDWPFRKLRGLELLGRFGRHH